jgi:hypothetical protein
LSLLLPNIAANVKNNSMNTFKITTIITSLLLVFLVACKSGDKDQSLTNQEALKDHVDLKIGESYVSQSSQAAAILEYRYKQEGTESYAAIEMDRWYYEFKAFGDQISPCLNGEYVDFLPDLTYEYGNNSGKLGGGKYHYNLETGVVLLVDNNASIKPREYLAKIAGPAMVLQGERTYGDNVFQAKLMMDYPNRSQKSGAN